MTHLMSFPDLQNNVFRYPSKRSSCLQEWSNMSQVTVLRFYIRRQMSANSSCNLHCDRVFFILCLLNHPLSLKIIRFFLPFLQILILEILTPGDSDLVPKVMPCVFYLYLRFFIFYWYKQPKIIGHLDRES